MWPNHLCLHFTLRSISSYDISLIIRKIFLLVFFSCPPSDPHFKSFQSTSTCLWQHVASTTLQKEQQKLLEKMALSRAGITDNTDVDISTKVRSFRRHFVNTTEQHQQNSTLHLIIACIHIHTVIIACIFICLHLDTISDDWEDYENQEAVRL